MLPDRLAFVFDSDLFVSRGAELAELDEWVQAPNSNRRLRTLVAPGGLGKTWFLRAAQDRWRARNEAGNPRAPARLPIWIDAPSYFAADNHLDEERMGEWCTSIARDLAEYCDGVPQDQDLDLSARIESLVTHLCNRCAERLTPIVIVDSYGEGGRSMAVLNDRVLTPFIRPTCVRMIIALRDPLSVKSYALRRHDQRFELGPLKSPHEQFEKLQATLFPHSTQLHQRNLQTWMDTFPVYHWNHALINAFLFSHALTQNTAVPTLTKETFDEAIRFVIERPDGTGGARYGPYGEDVYACLRQVAAKLPDEWTPSDLDTLEYRMHDPVIEPLFATGVVANVAATPRYKIADGLRELARERNAR